MDFAAHRQNYRDNHRTIGCKVTHMFGIPIIFVSLIVLFFSWKLGLGMFVGGWILQFIGHYVFEGNRPVLFGSPLNPIIYIYALVFALEEWVQLITTGSLASQDEE